jgi:hypothetical protein
MLGRPIASLRCRRTPVRRGAKLRKTRKLVDVKRVSLLQARRAVEHKLLTIEGLAAEAISSDHLSESELREVRLAIINARSSFDLLIQAIAKLSRRNVELRTSLLLNLGDLLRYALFVGSFATASDAAQKVAYIERATEMREAKRKTTKDRIDFVYEAVEAVVAEDRPNKEISVSTQYAILIEDKVHARLNNNENFKKKLPSISTIRVKLRKLKAKTVAPKE